MNKRLLLTVCLSLGLGFISGFGYATVYLKNKITAEIQAKYEGAVEKATEENFNKAKGVFDRIFPEEESDE